MNNLRRIFAGGVSTFFLASSTYVVAATNQVNVTVKEWRLVTNTTKVKAGDVVINAENLGKETHEIVILKTDVSYDKLPMSENGGVDEEKSGIAIDEIEDLEPKTTQTRVFRLEPGKYVLFCNIVEAEDGKLEEHYKMGMRAPLIVE